jgi:hypothetical protein
MPMPENRWPAPYVNGNGLYPVIVGAGRAPGLSLAMVNVAVRLMPGRPPAAR